jgi:D-glycero-D-manno-heptose 1,7-bisphosphate phosphatase
MKLIIFDLDGTLTPQRPSSAHPFERVLLPGVLEKCAELRAGGALLAVASNQGGIAKGLPIADLDEHMSWLKDVLGIQEWRCAIVAGQRKKPAPGMLLELVAHFGAAAGETLFVGDADADRLAAAAAEVAYADSRSFFGSDGI